MHFEDQESLERWQELQRLDVPKNFQYALSNVNTGGSTCWNWADWTVHGGVRA